MTTAPRKTRCLSANTIGGFQIESPGMRFTLRELSARTLSDLIVALALYRPGPLKGGLKDAFVRRHLKQEADDVFASRARTDFARDVWRDFVSGASPAHRARGGGLHAGAGGHSAPRHVQVPIGARDGSLAAEVHRRRARDQPHRRRGCAANLGLDGGVCGLRFSQGARGRLCRRWPIA